MGIKRRNFTCQTDFALISSVGAIQLLGCLPHGGQGHTDARCYLKWWFNHSFAKGPLVQASFLEIIYDKTTKRYII